MDGWDWWDVIVVTTNRFGLGWDTPIDTKRGGRCSMLARLAHERSEHLKLWPELDSEAAIAEFYRWRNWRMPEMSAFASIRESMSFV